MKRSITSKTAVVMFVQKFLDVSTFQSSVAFVWKPFPTMLLEFSKDFRLGWPCHVTCEVSDLKSYHMG